MGYTPPYLEVRKLSGGWGVYGPSSTTTDDLFIYPNTTDTLPYIKLNGNAGVTIAGYGLDFYQGATLSLSIAYATPDLKMECPIADKNIFLKTAGTGVVKFGTYTAGAATDSTGYITILDAAGNTRKLMVQA